jgi:hypothetical protein
MRTAVQSCGDEGGAFKSGLQARRSQRANWTVRCSVFCLWFKVIFARQQDEVTEGFHITSILSSNANLNRYSYLPWLKGPRNLFQCITVNIKFLHIWGTRWHCATGRKVVGSFPDGVIGIFNWLYPTGLRSTQPLREINTRSISWGRGCRRCAVLTTLRP